MEQADILRLQISCLDYIHVIVHKVKITFLLKIYCVT